MKMADAGYLSLSIFILKLNIYNYNDSLNNSYANYNTAEVHREISIIYFKSTLGHDNYRYSNLCAQITINYRLNPISYFRDVLLNILIFM